ncbi:hypothetical protein V7195_23300 [Priestia megaterium]|uniref:hypothetical protein n=1 Tax=Priestia megaterium TaxID=1404 RepID=UPI000BF9DB93|nr:hypothetical protein [Priestia megaterium]PFJ97849.1 hypothetical protein COI96_18985 [Priestia megaterium]PMD11745.1 hypothetical protein CJ194_09755 [Priestia megaterium]
MEVLLGIIAFFSFLAVIVGLIMLIPKSKRKLGVKIFFTGVVVFLVSFTIVINKFGNTEDKTSNESETASTEVEKDTKTEGANKNSTEAIPTKEATKKINWDDQVNSIALSDKSTTEKFDEVSKLASDYSLSDSELNEFQNYIVNEFKNKNYLKDIGNDEYMLANIFKSTAVEKHYDDSEQNPADVFAFDFLQNTKYTYRGVDAVDSDAVKSNEHQMDKSLKQLR